MPRPKKEKPNRADGLYEVKITIGKHRNGKLIRKSFYSSISKADAKEQAEQFKVDKAVAEATGVGFVFHKKSFSDWASYWLETYKKGKVKGNTYSTMYRVLVEEHLIKYFGNAALADIRPADVQSFFNEQKDYSLETLKKMRSILRAIFETAMENDLCAKNPVTRSITLSTNKKTPTKQTYTQEQFDIVENFAIAQNAVWMLVLLQTEITRSELLGLRWDDYDAKNRLLYISQGAAEFKDPDTDKWVLVSDGLKNEHVQGLSQYQTALPLR